MLLCVQASVSLIPVNLLSLKGAVRAPQNVCVSVLTASNWAGSQLEMDIFAYWLGQATLVHVVVASASLSASAGMVDGPWGAGHTVAVVAGVGGVVASVAVGMVMVAAAYEQGHQKLILKICSFIQYDSSAKV